MANSILSQENSILEDLNTNTIESSSSKSKVNINGKSSERSVISVEYKCK